MRDWLRRDLWALIRVAFHRKDFDHPWLYDRCVEVQREPDGRLDLWARDHRKSTIITFGKTVQDIIASHGDDPLPHWDGLEPTFCILSHTRPIAKSFLRQIKTELATNLLLRELYPDVLYESPDKQSPRWSEDNGICVKRKSNPKEATVEAWGLVDGMPTAKHFDVLVYDDVVTLASVTTPEQIKKTTTAYELSDNLGTAATRKRMIGTRYHFADTYRDVIERGAVIPRIHPATEDGTNRGKPVLLTQEQLDKKLRDQGPYTFSAQMLLNPVIDSKQTFARGWFDNRFDQATVAFDEMLRVLLCDPASGKKGTDYTAMAVIGLGPDQNYYLLDFLRDRINLVDRAKAFMRMHRRWRPQLSGYEEYGLQADIEHLKTVMASTAYHFEVAELGGSLGKVDRINRLIPIASAGRLWLPESLYRTNSEGRLEDLVVTLIEQEALPWPVPAHDDGLDVISRVLDVDGAVFPTPDVPEEPPDRYNKARRAGTWMSR